MTDTMMEIDSKPQPKISKTDLKTYYSKYFPYDEFFTWLGKDNVEYFERREFSFTSECYIRFQCFKDPKQLSKMLLNLLPEKIDLGAVYNTLPSMHNQVSFQPDSFHPVEKEIVFDIDMTDYDKVRTCCKEAKICNKCWKYMIVAYKILKQTLENDFGFKHLLWVFSGRRGIHCWVCDDRARKLGNDGRSAIANYIKYNIANTNTGVTAELKEPIHPLYENAINIINDWFEIIALKEQDLLNTKEGKELFIGLIKAHLTFKSKTDIDTFIKTKIEPVFERQGNSIGKYEQLKKELTDFGERDKDRNKSTIILNDFKLNILYPRLDINVSKHINHLLKSPFCIHPKTGMVSVPLDERSIMEFDVNKIPTIHEIVNDDKNGQTNRKYQTYKEIFNNFVLNGKQTNWKGM